MNLFMAKNVLKRFMKYFGELYQKDQDWTKRYTSGDDQVLVDLVERACKDLNVKRLDYEKTFFSNNEMQQLQRRLMNDLILGPIGSKGMESRGA